MQRMINNVRDGVSSGITREHLVTKQDVRKIKKISITFEGVMRLKNDNISTCAWIKELESLPVYSSIQASW